MDNKTLRTFVTVAKFANFSAAARDLHTVQPTVSRHISDLENELGVKLFQRNTHQVTLTAAGEWLLPEAQQILANEQKVKTLITQVVQKKREMNIGYLATACSFFLPDLIGQYRAQYPEVNAHLHEMTGEGQKEALLAGIIDVAFCRYQPDLDENEFSAVRIYADKLVALLPLQHTLAHESEIDLRQLAREKFILFQRSKWVDIYDQIVGACSKSGFEPQLVHHPENMRHLVTSVSSGLGVSIAPSCVRFIATRSCACVPITELDQVLPLYLYTRSSDDPVSNEFVDLCIQQTHYIQKQLDTKIREE